MADDHKQPYLQPYRKAVEKFGPGFEATLWGTREAQQLRFEVMIELAGFEECVILDAGCGQGDFGAYLLERDIPFARYVGIDALEEIIQAAIERGLPRCEFQVADFVSSPDVLKLVEADFVCLSGSLNTMDDEMARQLIQAAFEASAQRVIFNFLYDRPHPKWADKDLGPSRRFDTKGWLDWALSKSSRVSFTQDYLDGHDATIMIRHDE
ncbi:MAG: methyltransferase domain-containing protein [Planctomycetes bacterium]|nr:methyltransferase domain-containing protein [Planctomycetota bacterium]